VLVEGEPQKMLLPPARLGHVGHDRVSAPRLGPLPDRVQFAEHFRHCLCLPSCVRERQRRAIPFRCDQGCTWQRRRNLIYPVSSTGPGSCQYDLPRRGRKRVRKRASGEAAMSGATLIFWVIVALCALESAVFLALARFDPVNRAAPWFSAAFAAAAISFA